MCLRQAHTPPGSDKRVAGAKETGDRTRKSEKYDLFQENTLSVRTQSIFEILLLYICCEKSAPLAFDCAFFLWPKFYSLRQPSQVLYIFCLR